MKAKTRSTPTRDICVYIRCWTLVHVQRLFILNALEQYYTECDMEKNNCPLSIFFKCFISFDGDENAQVVWIRW